MVLQIWKMESNEESETYSFEFDDKGYGSKHYAWGNLLYGED